MSRLIDADKLLKDIAELKQSPWFNSKYGYADRKEAVEIIEDLCIKKEPTIDAEPMWIPCSEKLPEDEQPILFSTTTGRVHQGRFHRDNSVNQWYSSLDKMRAYNNVVIAWMPLPEPYKEKNDETD